MKIHAKSGKYFKCDVDLRGQEASPESSKGFCSGSRLPLTVLSIHAPKSMEINQNL